MRDRELTALAEEMWAITSDLFKFLQCRDRDALTACGLSVAQCYSLDAIGTHGQLSLNDLADSLYVTPSTASRTIEELVRKGLVERRQDPADRRAVCLTLTAQGRALFEAVRQHLVERQLAILQQIDASSRRDVLAALQKLSQAVKDPSCCAVPLVWKPPPLSQGATRAEGLSAQPQRSSRRARRQTPTPR
ncbi:MAG: MarR family transcriptional regulator [Candidatus Tectomicrobia bacterium]|nr:MarR family transcriptional regulator [Candidatus Tectomicrobia bacterium]